MNGPKTTFCISDLNTTDKGCRSGAFLGALVNLENLLCDTIDPIYYTGDMSLKLNRNETCENKEMRGIQRR